MRICLVTSFPPSHERLNEYGFHLANELQRDPYLSLTILGDEYQGPELGDFDVLRCWKPNDFRNPMRLLRKILDIRPDVVWFNAVFSSFGTNPVTAFLGLCTPAIARAAGFSTHVTLHHLMEGIDMADAGIRHERLYHLGGTVATRLLLMSDSVTVLLPAYRRTLIEKYRGANVHLRAHGIFASRPQYPDFSRRDNPAQRILAFGKWGTYKRLEILLQAFEQVAKEAPNAHLVIAGENHPSATGYVESIAARVKDNPRITVRGYVPEADIPDLFATASVLVMPYNSATGSSGVAHQACEFGVPIICADISEFRDMAIEERIAMQFYRRGDPASLTRSLVSLLLDNELRRDMAEQNFHAAMRMTMPQIVRQYLRAFDWHRHAHTPALAARLGLASTPWRAYAARASATPPSPAVVPIVGAKSDSTDQLIA
jgi:glycosyltransferase involved in cell wall biosynthesis